MRPVPEREAARAAGALYYTTGKPCKNGHMSDRLTSTGKCVICTSESYQRWLAAHQGLREQRTKAASEWKRKHPEKNREHSNRYSAKNRETVRAKNRKWHASNKEWVRRYNIEYRRKHPERHKTWFQRWEAKDPLRAAAVKRASKLNRRAREKLSGGSVNGKQVAQLFKLQRNRCAGCGGGGKFTVDHITPVAKGGTGDASNLQLLCFSCNRSKSDKDVLVWAREHGRLL